MDGWMGDGEGLPRWAGGWVGQLGMWERRLMSGRNFNWPLPGRQTHRKRPPPRKCPLKVPGI